MNSAPASSYAVVSTLCCFGLSVVASSLAIHLYSLLRTGQIGASWRVLIIASVLFSLVQAAKLAEVSGLPYAEQMRLSSIVELIFVLALAYAFYLQRQVFSEAGHTRRDTEESVEDESVVSVYEA